jgi:hypothetical protein
MLQFQITTICLQIITKGEYYSPINLYFITFLVSFSRIICFEILFVVNSRINYA